MESKKINQLATELTPALSDLTIIGDPTTGISKKITLSQMASLFTGTVEEYANLAAFPLVGVADTIYIALDTNVLYRWDTGLTSYVELSPNIINSLVFNDANGFDGTISLAGSVATLTITTALTTGSVGFIGASGALTQDNSNFYWDNSNKRLGINTNAPTTALDVFGSGIIGRLNGTSTNNAYLGFASAGTNKWSIGNVQSDHRFRIYSEANTSELVSVLQTGEFGIGIANPTTKLHIDGGASALITNLDANVSVAKSISFRSDNSARINLEVSGTESGSNAGADLFIRRYSDAGSLINTALYLQRSTGNIAFGGTTITDSNIINIIGDSSSVNIGVVLNNTNTTNAKIYGIQNVSKNLVFYDYSLSAARLTIDSVGSIGIGTTPPPTTNFSHLFVGRNISMFSGSSTDIYIGSNFYYDGGFKVRYSEASAMINTNAGAIIFQNSQSGTAGGTFNGIERFRIANNGAITQSKDSIYGINTTDGTDNGYLALCGAGADGDNRGGHIYLSGNERAADAGTVVLAAGNVSGGSIQFRTGASVERARINNSGYAKFTSTGSFNDINAQNHEFVNGTQGNNSHFIGNTNSSFGGATLLRLNCVRVTTNGTYNLIAATNGNSTGEFIVRDSGNCLNTNNSYTGTSDIKLKQDIIDASSQWEDIKQMRIRKFRFKKQVEQDENAPYLLGVIAQELELVSPNLVDETPDFDGTDEEVTSTTKSVKYSIIYMKAVKALQEAMEKIEILEEKVKKLEAK